MQDNNSRPFEEQALFMLGQLDSKVDSLVSSKADHETRIGSLEGFKHYLLGMAALSGGLFSLVWDWIKNGHSS